MTIRNIKEKKLIKEIYEIGEKFQELVRDNIKIEDAHLLSLGGIMVIKGTPTFAGFLTTKNKEVKKEMEELMKLINDVISLFFLNREQK